VVLCGIVPFGNELQAESKDRVRTTHRSSDDIGGGNVAFVKQEEEPIQAHPAEATDGDCQVLPATAQQPKSSISQSETGEALYCLCKKPYQEGRCADLTPLQ
jgi:hypothetical protein